MRYDKSIKLIKSKSEYDYDTGDTINKYVEVVDKMAFVSGVSAENKKLLFGDIETDTKVFRMKNGINFDFNLVKYKDKLYRIKSIQTYRDDVAIYGSVDNG